MAQQRIILGRYAQIERMGQGASATVDLCWDSRIRRYVAIKRLPLAQRADNSAAPGLTEARTAASLNHPHIVSVYDFEVEDNEALLIMEAIEGPALYKILEETPAGRLDLDIIASIADSVAEALQFAHGSHILHLDVKPDNILVDLQGRTKLSDFGIAKLADARGLALPTGGTIGYMPPEQLQAQELDQRCDVFALGMVVYEMLTGENPFFADTIEESLKKINKFNIDAPSSVRHDIPSTIDDVLIQAIDPDCNNRYEDVEEFVEHLIPILGNPKRGQKKLKNALNKTDEDEPDPATASKYDQQEKTKLLKKRNRGPRTPLWERFDEHHGFIAGRILSFILCWWCAALGITNFEIFSTPISILVALVAGAVGLVGFGIGAALSLVVLGASIIYNPDNAIGLGVMTILFAAAWVACTGRRSISNSCCGICIIPLCLAWASPLAPVLAGYFLRPLYALSAVLLNIWLALLLAMLTGSASLLHCNLAIIASQGSDVEILLNMLQNPQFWIISISWIVGSVLFSLLCSRKSKIWSFLGIFVCAAVMLGAHVLVVLVQTGQLGPINLPWTISTALALVLGAFLCASNAPRPDDN